MYLSLLGKPSDEDLERYPAVHLTGPHEWDPSVLDFTHLHGDGESPWSNDRNERFAFDPNFDEFGDHTHRSIQTLNILNDSSLPLTPFPTIRASQHVVNNDTPDCENSDLLVGSMLILSRKTWNSLPNGSLHSQYFPYEETLQV